MIITNPLQLMPLVSDAVQLTISQLLEQLKQIIERTVYSYPATWTNGWDGEDGRTHEFGDSWDKTAVQVMGAVAESEIFENALTYNEPFSHGLDAEALCEVISDGLHNTGIGFPAMPARPFWDEFVAYVSENINQMFATNCRVMGLDVDTTGLGWAMSL